MKYLIFTAVLCSVPLMSAVLAVDKRMMRLAMWGLLFPLLLLDSTAINFFSFEDYRGTSRGMEVSVIYLIALAVLLAKLFMHGFRSPFPTLGSKLYLCYILLSLPSFSNADNQLYAFCEIWKMLMIYLVYLAVYYYLLDSQGDYKTFIYGLIIVTVCIFYAVVRQHFSGVYQVRAQLPHQNSLSMFMSPLALLFLSYFLNRKGIFKKLIIFFAFVLATGALLRTYSRGAIACFPLGGAVTAGLSLLLDWKTQKFQILGGLGIVAILIGLAFTPRIIERFETAPESSGQNRKNLASAAMNMIRDQPLYGVGINNWGIKINPPYQYSHHRDPSKGYSADFKDGIVETIYLLVCAECGIPCFLMLLTMFGYYWWVAFRCSIKLRKTPYFYIPVGIIGGLTIIYLQSILEWVLKQQVNFIELLILYAFLDYLNKNTKAIKQRCLEYPHQVEKIA